MLAGYRPIVAPPAGGRWSERSTAGPVCATGFVAAFTYRVGVDLDFDRFDPSRPPVVLVGGLNLVRAIGLGGLDAIVAYWDPDEPAFASRYCRGRLQLPKPGPDGAAAEALHAP